jgi:CHAT domain-containing protein
MDSQPKALHLIAQISQQGAPVEIFLGEDFAAKKNNKSKPLESKPQRQIQTVGIQSFNFGQITHNGENKMPQFLLLLTLLLSTVIFSISTTVHANDEAQIKNFINTVYEQFCVGNSQVTKSSNALETALETSLFSTKPEVAEKRLRQAIFFTQAKNLQTDNVMLEILYRLQRQLGKHLKTQQKWQQSSYAYRQARNSLSQLRKIAAFQVDTKIHQTFKQVSYELIDILLKRYENEPENRQILLREVIEVAEELKQAELENYFQDECLVEEEKLLGVDDDFDLPNNTAIFYPIIFPETANLPNRSAELLLILSNKQIKWIRQDKEKWRSVTVSITELNKKIRQFRNQLQTPPMRNSRKIIKQSGEELYKLFISPLENELDNLEILVFVPDGALRTIPITALFDGKAFVVTKHYAVATIPGLSLTKSVGKPLRKNPRLLLGGTSSAVSISDAQHFNALTHTDKALKSIEELFPRSSTTKLFKQGQTLFKINQLKREMHRVRPYTIIHLHTHGIFQSGDTNNSFLLTDDLIENQNGSRLTMKRLEEIFSIGELRQSPIELLTLSACQTAQGDEQAALGLAGVAFKSGARSVVATLWNADEPRTTELMRRFYEQLREQNLSKAKALQQAQQQMLGIQFFKEQEKCHPQKEIVKDNQGKVTYCHRKTRQNLMLPTYWAPFILIGNWF